MGAREPLHRRGRRADPRAGGAAGLHGERRLAQSEMASRDGIVTTIIGTTDLYSRRRGGRADLWAWGGVLRIQLFYIVACCAEQRASAVRLSRQGWSVY